MRKLAKTELEEYLLTPKEAPVVATQKIVEPVETTPPAPPAQQARQKPRRSRGKKTLELPLRPSKEAVLSKLSPPALPIIPLSLTRPRISWRDRFKRGYFRVFKFNFPLNKLDAGKEAMKYASSKCWFNHRILMKVDIF